MRRGEERTELQPGCSGLLDLVCHFSALRQQPALLYTHFFRAPQWEPAADSLPGASAPVLSFTERAVLLRVPSLIWEVLQTQKCIFLKRGKRHTRSRNKEGWCYWKACYLCLEDNQPGGRGGCGELGRKRGTHKPVPRPQHKAGADGIAGTWQGRLLSSAQSADLPSTPQFLPSSQS